MVSMTNRFFKESFFFPGVWSYDFAVFGNEPDVILVQESPSVAKTYPLSPISVPVQPASTSLAQEMSCKSPGPRLRTCKKVIGITEKNEIESLFHG
jgi:hypothetical protein